MARSRYQKGSLLLRGKRNPVWIGRWLEDERAPGQEVKRVHRSVILGTKQEVPTRKLALRLLETRLAEVNSYTYQPKVNMTFADFNTRWQKTVLPQYKVSTQHETRNQINARLLPQFGDINLRDITTERLQEWVASLILSPKSVRNLVGTLRAMWRAAKSWGYVQHSPFEGLSLPKPVKPETRCFTLDEVQRILAAAPEPLRTYLWLAAETGMRASELGGLRKEDVDCEKGIVRVRQRVWRGNIDSPKTSAGTRQFAISDALALRLANYLSTRSGDSVPLLFTTATGRPWSGNKVVQRRLRPLLAKLGIAHGGLHAFRHFQATELDRRGVGLRVQLARMGHSSMRSNRQYGRAEEADDKRFASELGEVLCSNLPNNTNGLAAVSNEAIAHQ